MKAKMDIYQGKMEATIHSIWFEVEEAIIHQVVDVLLCVYQKTRDLRKEVTEKTDKTQVDLQAIRTSADVWTKNLLEIITDTTEHLHEELGFMIQVEPQITKTVILTT
jgi:hypothetical protein